MNYNGEFKKINQRVKGRFVKDMISLLTFVTPLVYAYSMLMQMPIIYGLVKSKFINASVNKNENLLHVSILFRCFSTK